MQEDSAFSDSPTLSREKEAHREIDTVTEPFDPKKSYLSIKTHEGIIAFAGFLFHLEENGPEKEGILKISSFHKAYGGGYLTLTFIVDTGDNPALRDQLDPWFNRLTESALREHIGQQLERINKVSLDALAHVENWYIEEINLYFRSVEGEEKTLIEQCLIPAIQNILPCTFHPVEWWPAAQAGKAETDLPDSSSSDFLKGLFRRWFKSDQ